jgi:hypothetical protein
MSDYKKAIRCSETRGASAKAKNQHEKTKIVSKKGAEKHGGEKRDRCAQGK